MAGSRVSQQPVLPLIDPDDLAARVSQEPVLVVTDPDDLKARVSQAAALALADPDDVKARMSREAVLVLQSTAGNVVSAMVVLALVPNVGTGGAFGAVLG